jgi:hypothetical protein
MLSRKRRVQYRLSGEELILKRFFGFAFLAGYLGSLNLQTGFP